jgi:hypothetical protein
MDSESDFELNMSLLKEEQQQEQEQEQDNPYLLKYVEEKQLKKDEEKIKKEEAEKIKNYLPLLKKNLDAIDKKYSSDLGNQIYEELLKYRIMYKTVQIYTNLLRLLILFSDRELQLLNKKYYLYQRDTTKKRMQSILDELNKNTEEADKIIEVTKLIRSWTSTRDNWFPYSSQIYMGGKRKTYKQKRNKRTKNKRTRNKRTRNKRTKNKRTKN